jgi:hypothetical protein
VFLMIDRQGKRRPVITQQKHLAASSQLRGFVFAAEILYRCFIESVQEMSMTYSQ